MSRKKRPTPLNFSDNSNSSSISCSSPKSPSRHEHLAYLASRRFAGRRQSNFLELPTERAAPRENRVNSLPAFNPRHDFESELYRLRSFNITTGNRIVNCGDSFIPIGRSKSNTSVNSGSRTPFDGSCCPSSAVSSSSLFSCELMASSYRILLLGDTSVGKSALVQQFTTSDYINTYDASLDDEFGERTVSVLLDNTESELVFIDHPAAEMSAENSLSTYEPHGCIVVYSVTDRSSFEVAGDILRYLWQEGVTHDKAVILVANKCDLERAREISFAEGKNMANNMDSKFIEASSGIQHNVDELLVGILKQCRLRENTKKRRTRSIHNFARELIGKLGLKSKSCQNLHVL